jgi:hypothetical protein
MDPPGARDPPAAAHATGSLSARLCARLTDDPTGCSDLVDLASTVGADGILTDDDAQLALLLYEPRSAASTDIHTPAADTTAARPSSSGFPSPTWHPR